VSSPELASQRLQFHIQRNLSLVLLAVVKLFNAIRTQQKVTDVAVSRAADSSHTSRAIEKAKNGVYIYFLQNCQTHLLNYTCFDSVNNAQIKLP
jgi:hypothetical protein